MQQWRKAARLAPAWLLLAAPALHAARPDDKALKGLEDQLLAHITVLAGDDYAGREPGTEGESKTLRYIARQLFDMGVVSGTNQPARPWFAPVRLLGREPAGSVAQFFRRGRPMPVAPDEALILTSGRRSLVQGAPLFFVGQGTSVPPRAELAGRVAVLLDGDAAGEPEFGAASEARQNALLAGGAAAVITVLDGRRDLASVAANRRRPGYAVASEALGGDLEGFLAPAAFERLLASGPETLARLRAEAARADFVPHPLDLTASLEATTRETSIRTHNLIGKIPGRRPERGAVLLLAHWDHFGSSCTPPGTRPQHIICNGAIDNASGVAALLEVTRRLAHLPQGLDRDVYILATTGEELGLLGAEAFAENPSLPLSRIVAAFNLDSIAIAPAGTPIGVVGQGLTPLDPGIAVVAREQRRKLADGDFPNRYIRRQDGWALMNHDVPAVMASSAYGDPARLERYFAGDYHSPGDVVKPGLELGGEAQDVLFHVALVQYFADAARYPGPAINTAALRVRKAGK